MLRTGNFPVPFFLFFQSSIHFFLDSLELHGEFLVFHQGFEIVIFALVSEIGEDHFLDVEPLIHFDMGLSIFRGLRLSNGKDGVISQIMEVSVIAGFSTSASEGVDKVVEFVLDFDFGGVELNDLAVVGGQDSESLA